MNVSAKVPAGMEPARFYTAVSALDQFYWVAATALGCALGAAASFDTKGISFVMTALFTAIFTGQWLDAKEHRPALVGVGASAACLVLFGPSGFILPAMAASVGILLLLRPAIEKQKERQVTAP